jgi:biotin transport system permease protein
MIPLYIHRHSPIHRIAAGPKLLLLLAASTAIFFLDPLWLLLATLLGTIGLYRLARLPLAAIAGALRPVLFVGALIFALQLFLAGPGEAARILLRLFTAILLVSLVTLTTRFSDMLDVLTRLTRPLARFGLDPPRLALAVGLTIRFIPPLLRDLHEIRQAQRARRAGGLRSFGAGPLIVKILRMTDALGHAIAARGFENRK